MDEYDFTNERLLLTSLAILMGYFGDLIPSIDYTGK